MIAVIVVGYFIVALIVLAVLSKLVLMFSKTGKISKKATNGLTLVALLWPLWGEIAVVLIIGYVIVKSLLYFANLDSQEAKAS